MQATISRRFLVCLVALLGTTLLPWLFYARFQGQKYELNFGLDLKGGASITYRVRAVEEEGKDQAAILKDAIRVTQFRVDQFGVSEVNIFESGADQFTVELPGRGKEEIDRIKGIMKQVGSLEFRIVAKPELAGAESARREREKEAYVPTPGFRWYGSDGEDGQKEYLLEVPDVKAKALRAARRAAPCGAAPFPDAALDRADAEARFQWDGKALESANFGRTPMQEGGQGYEVYFSIIPSRKSAFGDFTGDNIDRQMAIVLNGKVTTAPVIHSKLPGGGKIYSSANPYSQAQAQDLVTVLQSGSLRVKPEEVSSFVVGPGLGEDAVRRGRIAVGVSFLLVIAFMAVFYRGAGWVANLAVLLNLVMTLGVLIFLDAALSLPGIAGLLLTLGMAVDANILVNERIREEKAAGKGLLQAVTAGYDRAFITILDSNLTTIITAVILYWIGTGPIRGFALTLILGLVISMFTALYVTRTLFLWGMEKGILTEFSMLKILGKITYDWMGLRANFFRVSIAAVAAGSVFFALRSVEDKYDLEFTGGQKVVIAMKSRMSMAEVQSRIQSQGLGEVALRTIRARGTDSESMDLATESDSYELTARIKDEVEGAAFTRKVEAAFKAELVPNAVEELAVGAAGADGKVPFSLVVNFETESITAATVKEVLLTADAYRSATDLTVDPTDSYPGAVSFKVAGKMTPASGRDPALALAEDLVRAVEAREGVDLSEPLPQSDFIGPGVARRLRDQAILAILLSLLAQIVYLRLRFRDFTYGFAAAIALVHDVLFTLGAVALVDSLGLFHVKINLPVIASFLTLIGFSMNDTIVVFDRIRENLGRNVHPTSTLINQSINQTLSRTIRTSMTVLLVAMTLLFVNMGAASSLEGFAFVMTVGVVVGSYSSVAIASPMLLFLPVYFDRLRKLGRGPVLGLVAAFLVGMVIAITQDGIPSRVGEVLALLLPGHMLLHLFGWVVRKDPDAMVAALEDAKA